MKLLTSEIKAELYKRDLVVRETGDCDSGVAVKMFCPWGSATWWIKSGTPLGSVNGEPTDDVEGAKDWHLFGRCDLFGDGGELGYVLLSELEAIKGPAGLTIERDIHFDTSGEITIHNCV